MDIVRAQSPSTVQVALITCRDYVYFDSEGVSFWDYRGDLLRAVIITHKVLYVFLDCIRSM